MKKKKTVYKGLIPKNIIDDIQKANTKRLKQMNVVATMVIARHLSWIRFLIFLILIVLILK